MCPRPAVRSAHLGKVGVKGAIIIHRNSMTTLEVYLMEATEKSEAARRASLARKVHRGGRPRKDDLPERTAKLYARDLAIIRGFAGEVGVTVKAALAIFAHAIVAGGTFKARPHLKPDGWRVLHPPVSRNCA